MATKRTLVCGKCGSLPIKVKMFDLLMMCAKGGIWRCSSCHAPAHVGVEFDLGLDADDGICTVIRSFTPTKPESWRSGTGTVTFYPFLVLLYRRGRGGAIWLPYWHRVERGGRITYKYGQWAPFMDEGLFAGLLRRAGRRGFDLEKPRWGKTVREFQALVGPSVSR